jgi:hypothetical protein
MTPRTVNAIPMANTKLAGFGAMYPSWLQYLVVPVLVLVPRANGGRCVSYFTLRWLFISQPQIWGPFPGMHELRSRV